MIGEVELSSEAIQYLKSYNLQVKSVIPDKYLMLEPLVALSLD